MAHTLTLWLDRFLSGAASSPQRTVDHKPVEIEVERLPDYFWRDLASSSRGSPAGSEAFTRRQADPLSPLHRQGD
jgi:hypothetical protein